MNRRKCLDCGSTNVWCECDLKKFDAEKIQEKLPPFLLRPHDGEIFSINSDGQTYSTHTSKKQFPDNFHHAYSYKDLIKLGFYYPKGLVLEESNE